MTASFLATAWDVVTIVAIVCIVCTSLFLYLTWEDINFNAKDKDEGRQTRVDRRDANGGRSNPSPVPPVRRQDHSSHPPDLLEDIHYDVLLPDWSEFSVLRGDGRTRTLRERRRRR